MFNKFIADTLTSYLGEYFEIIDHEQVKVSIWNGLVCMQNLKVRKDALRNVDVPVCVLTGVIEELTIRIPWMHLRSESVVVQIRKARIILADKETADYGIERDAREAHARKIRELAAMDKAIFAKFCESSSHPSNSVETSTPVTSQTSSEEDSSDKNFTARLKSIILNNIRIEVEELSVHYTSCTLVSSPTEDDLLSQEVRGEASATQPPRGKPQSSVVCTNTTATHVDPGVRLIEEQVGLSFQIKEIKTYGCNERFEPAFTSPGERVARQLISFRGLSASLQGEESSNTKLPILKPFDVLMEIVYQPVYLDVSTPQYMASVRVNGVCTSVISSKSCTTCYDILQHLLQVRQRQALRRLRPLQGRPNDNPQAWWRYTLDAVQQQVLKRKSAASASARRSMPFSWPTYTSVKRKRDLYTQLYLRQQRTALGATEWLDPLTVDEQVSMAALEIELSIDVLKLGKKLAVERVALERAEYETLLRQKALVSSTSGTSDSRPVHPTARPITPPAPTSKIGWFSWSWESQPTVSASVTVPGNTDSGPSDRERAELRELVQLMTAERWSEAQRVAIAKEFGMDPEEANALARHDAPRPASTHNSATTDPPERTTSHHTIPSCIVFFHARALMVELQSCVRGAPSALSTTEGKRTAATPASDTLAQVTLHVFQAGTEWGGANSVGGSALPAVYYWGTIDGLSLTATSSWLDNNGQQSTSATERALLSICRSGAHNDPPKDSSPLRNTLGTGSLLDSLFDTVESRASARCTGPRTFSPLEYCWSILPGECHRHASVSLEYTQSSLQQLTSKSSALHHVRVKLGKVDLSMDVVLLRHLSDFFFTVIWPETFPENPAAGEGAGNVHISPSTPVACSPDSDFTALEIPNPTSLTHAEQRCTADTSVRLAVLRTKLEHQRSIDWSVTVDSMQISLDETPQVQGCELTLTQVSVQNAMEHRTQRQERLRDEVEGDHSRANTSGSLKMSTTAALGSLDTDWIDQFHIRMATVRLCVFFPTSPTVSADSRAIKQCVLLPETPMNAVVERNLLGRGHPDLPQWNLRISSSHPVRLKWSRTSLSVLTTACCLLRDFADSFWFSVGQRGADEACHVNCVEKATFSSFHVRVLPHPTGKKFFHPASTPESDLGASSNDDNPKPATEKWESYLEQLHQLSATDERSASVVGAALPQRLDVRHGVCVVYHAKLSTFPAQYYTLQHGCTHVYRDGGARDSTASGTDSVTAGHRVHLYVSQGGRSHDEALGCDYTSATRLLVQKLKIPPELLKNSVFLKDAVDTWLEETKAGEGNNNAPSQEQVRNALREVLLGIQAVPCRYVAFECASSAEADAVEAALRQCCVSASTPPLLLRPSVQARYNTAVSEPEFCKRSLHRMEVSFPSLQITCEGSEPALCSSSVHVNDDEADNGKSSRPDAILSLTPFFCRQDGYPEKDCYQLDVKERVLLFSRTRDNAGGNSDLKLLEASTPSNSPATLLDSCTKGDSGIFSMRLVCRKRPVPLPSVLHCSLSVGEAARMQLRVGPSLLEWCEAWWDTVGLLTKKLFAEEIIPGYPWWRSHELLEKTQKETICTDVDLHSSIATDVETRWCETKEFGGNERRVDVDLTVPVLEVEVDLEGDAEAQAPLSYTPMLRYSALGTAFQWRMTEASHHVLMSACSPQLKWRCSSDTKFPPSRTNWVTLMQSKKDSTTSGLEDGGAKLSVDWKLRRPPPMLSSSDWVCAGDGSGEGVEGKSRMGIRDVQDLKVDLSCVELFYWHPLLMHLLQRIQEDLVPRALAMVARGPCWFASGTLFCPPLSWRAPEKSEAIVSWTHVFKSVTLQSVQLLLPKQVDWIAQAVSSPALPPAPHLRLSLKHGIFTDCLRVSSSPTVDHSPLKTAVNLVLAIRFSNIDISHVQPSPGCAFHWRLPSLHVEVTEPLFHVQCLWRAEVPWVRSLVVELPSLTDPCIMECSNVDLAHVSDLLHANFLQPAALRAGERSPSMNVLPPASLLKVSVRKSTSTLTIKGNLMLCVSPSQRASSHSDDLLDCCVLRLSGASASLTHSTAGELSFSFATHRLWLGCSLPSRLSSDWSETGGLSVVQVAPKHTDGSSPVLGTSIALRYGWRWLVNPEEGSGCTANTDPSAKKDVFFLVDSLGVVTVTLNGSAVTLLRETIVDNPHLRKSALRYVVEDSQSPSRTNASKLCHDTSGCNQSREPAQQKLQINLNCLQCCIPCSADPIHPFRSAFSTPNLSCPMLKCAISMVQIELCKSLSASRATVCLAQLLHCILSDPRGSSGGSSAVVIPLVLEQPTEWQVPLTRYPPPHRQASSTHMERAKLGKANLLDELFGEPPAEASLEPTKVTMQTGSDCTPLTISRASRTKNLLSVVLDDHPAQLNIILDLQPLWLVAPSTICMEGILSGMRTHVNSCTAALLKRGEANVSPVSTIATVSNPHRSHLLQLRSGSISLFVCEKGVVAPAMTDTPASSLERTVRQAMDTQETLVLFTESATVEWNSELPDSQILDEPQTVVHLENISICALQGIQSSAVLLERFSIRVQRLLTQSGAPFLPGAAEAPGAVEEWHLALDTIHLTLRQRHYTALLRLALQQTSLLAAMMKLRSSVMQSFTVAATASDLLATAEKPKPHDSLETNTRDQARCFRFRLTSLRVCVKADEGKEVTSSPEAVYLKLNDFDAVYYTGQHDQCCLLDCGDVLNERGVTPRLAVTLSRCLLGTEHDIPTLVITAASSTGAEKATRTPCSLRFAQEEKTGIYTGSVQVGKVTVTMEALSMTTWLDLLYTPYLQETVSDYQAKKENRMQQDLWLSEDLVLSERTPLKVSNKMYSLLHLYGNGHTIHMKAPRRGQLIFLDEGVTLRIMHAIVDMEGPSIDEYVAAGDGSYVLIDSKTCSRVQPSSTSVETLCTPRTGELAADHEMSKATGGPTNAKGQSASVRWQRLLGEVEVELRIPEPHSVSGEVTTRRDNSDGSFTASTQRTLVLYSHMNLCLMKSRPAATDEDELTAAFDLVHAGVRSEYVAHHSGAAVNTTHLVSDWAMKVFLADEKRYPTDCRPAAALCVRTIHVSASTGIEVKMRYTDAVFVERSARHAQAAATRLQDAVRRDVQIGLSSLQHGWGTSVTTRQNVDALPSMEHHSSDNRASAVMTSQVANDTMVTLSISIPYVNVFIIDDSHDTDSPLFRLRVNDILTPQYTMEPLKTCAELRFLWQLEYYEMTRSQWAPVIDPVEMTVSVTSRRNTSVIDLYNRKGYLRLSARAGSVKLCFTPAVAQHMRQLLTLRDKFDLSGANALAVRGAFGQGAASAASSCHSFKIVQTTGIDAVVQLPEYMENRWTAQQRAHVLHTGQEWEFSLPRIYGKEPPPEYQKIIVDQHRASPSSGQTARPGGAVISLSSAGMQRVSMGATGALQRYILADVSPTPQWQGQKQVVLRTLVTFTNRLSMTLLQVSMNESGTYDAVGTLPPASSQCIPVQLLRRRVILALSDKSEAPAPDLSTSRMQLGEGGVVSLGLSYDSLPCLAGTVLLGVCRCAHDSSRPPHGGGKETTDRRIAVGNNFEVHSGSRGKQYFLLRVQAAPEQPADVLRYPLMSPLRAVVVTAEPVVTIRNAVGVPLTLTLLTRRTQSSTRFHLLEASPDQLLFTQLCSVVVSVDGSYGVTEVDPLEDLYLSVCLQQPNGNMLVQWPSAQGVGVANAQHPPACVYSPSDEPHCDTQLVLVDLTTGATLLLAIKCKHREVTLYSPHWIINETNVPLQLADSCSMNYKDAKCHAVPIAGLSGRTVHTATVAPWGSNLSSGDQKAVSEKGQPFLYNSLRAEWRKKNKKLADGEGLVVRLWESTGAEAGGGDEQSGWSEWSSVPLLVHETAAVQVISCASRHMRGKVWMLSYQVNMGHQADIPAYSDTCVVSIRPRWVLVNNSPYPLRFAQRRNDNESLPLVPMLVAAPFSQTALSTVVGPERSDGRQHPLLCFAMCSETVQNADQSSWSPPFTINSVEERYVNLVYQTFVSLAEHWPETASAAMCPTVEGVVDRMPPLRPEDIQDVNGEPFVKREEAKVFSITTYKYKGCMMCVQVEEPAQPPLILENRTPFTVCFRQRGTDRISTVFPRRRKAWTWDVPPAAGPLSAEVELWVVPSAVKNPSQRGRNARQATCVLNLDPHLIGRRSTGAEAFQGEIEVTDTETGTSSLLFVRARGVHGISYAVSITMEPTIDTYRTLPFRQFSFSIHLSSLYILCRASGEQEREMQDLLLLAVNPVDFSFVQGARVSNEMPHPVAREHPAIVEGGDVQRIALRFRSFQVDDERPSAKERVVAQLVDDKDSGFQIEREMLRITPILHCSVAAVYLTPVELHIEDSFITAVMRYKTEVGSSWVATWPSNEFAREGAHVTTYGRHAVLPPWKAQLERKLMGARQHFRSQEGSSAMSWKHPASTVPLWSRVLAIRRLLVDPLFVSLSLYRSPGAAEDPIWKLFGAVSLLISSTQDVRLEWDPVQRVHVCDTLWHLLFLLQESYMEQMKNQYMKLVSILGLNTVRSFVSDLLNSNRGSRDSDFPTVMRRQKPRVPRRPGANLRFGQSAGGQTTSLWQTGAASIPFDPSVSNMAVVAETPTVPVSLLLQVPNRAIQVNPHATVTVAEVARDYAWTDFMAVAQAQEIKAYGGCALGRALAEMRTTPRYSLQVRRGEVQRPRASEIVRITFDANHRGGAGASSPLVDCSRCAELEALREVRLLNGEPTPLPHPVRDGFITWEEFAHHINWYEFVDMCTDEEVRTYATLVHQAASEPSCNVCILKSV